MSEIAAGQRSEAAVSAATVGDYVALMKPRVMSLVIFTALVGLLIAPGQIHPVIGFAAILCIAAGAGASAVLNMWFDADIDAKMTRTRTRPIPAGRVTREEALAFGMVLSVASVASLGVLVNWVAAALLAFTIAFYVGVYTMWLKRLTAQNIVIGGLAGALPPVIGWAAATGEIALPPLVLCLITFLWTPAHFWALALVKSDDYARAGVPMLPVVKGARVTQLWIVVYAVLTSVAALLPYALGFAGLGYAVTAALLGIAFSALSILVAFTPPHCAHYARRAYGLFGFSILYLFAIFGALLAERML